jgi:hypothetical protein
VALADGPSLAISIDGGEQEPVAERITVLPPATYDFTAELVASGDSPTAQLVWELRCESAGAQVPVWRFSPDPLSGRRSYTSRLVLTRACPVQHLTLSVRAGDPRLPSSIRIMKMTLKPVQNAL